VLSAFAESLQGGGAGARAAELRHAGAVSTEQARRIACDAVVSVLDAKSGEPLGAATRTVPPALRRALEARDGGCCAPGCDRGPEWCEGHHRKHWIDGGPTTLENTELRCRVHHRLEHEEGGRGRARGQDARIGVSPPKRE
jgi:hypothetical protein